MLKTLVRLALVAALVYTFMLYRWSERGDPRFFAALDSKPGRWAAKVFGWQTSVPLGKGDLDAEPETLSAAEKNYRSMVERDIREAAPLLGIAPDTLAGGRLQVRYKEIRLKRKFPELVATAREGITIFLPRPHLIGARAIHDALQTEVRELRDRFSTLAAPGAEARIDVVLFANENDLRAFMREADFHSEQSLGIYDLATRTVFSIDPRGLEPIRKAEAMTTLRHESAHAWFYAAGIHSTTQVEGNWLVEGLAVYAQEERVGAPSPPSLAVLRKARDEGKLMPLAELVRIRERGGFLSLAGEESVEAAYLQSWALVHLLMGDQHRPRFFAYLQYLRNPAHAASISQRDAYLILCEILEIPSAQLEQEYARMIGT